MQELHSVPVQFCLVLEKEAEEEGGSGYERKVIDSMNDDEFG
jgi:hypothetical protein